MNTATFRFGEFTLDCGSHLLTHRGVRQHLSPKAQQLLQLLLLARPRALSREELYDALWPSTFVCETNLTSIINEVRRALGDDARAPQYVRTVHGFGYAFCGEVLSGVSVKPPSATLYCEGVRHPLYDGDNVIGRASECQVVVTASTVSRRHALITIHNGTFSIRDLASKNGTYVDGRPVGSLPATITHRASIAFGVVTALIECRKSASTKSILPDSDLKRRVAEKMAAT